MTLSGYSFPSSFTRYEQPQPAFWWLDVCYWRLGTYVWSWDCARLCNFPNVVVGLSFHPLLIIGMRLQATVPEISGKSALWEEKNRKRLSKYESIGYKQCREFAFSHGNSATIPLLLFKFRAKKGGSIFRLLCFVFCFVFESNIVYHLSIVLARLLCIWVLCFEAFCLSK